MKEYAVMAHGDCVQAGFLSAKEAFDYINDRDAHGYDVLDWSVKQINYISKTISYLPSTSVRTRNQLETIFKDEGGIEIDGKIYTSADSILKASKFLDIFYFGENELGINYNFDFSEFFRIYDFAEKIKNQWI